MTPSQTYHLSRGSETVGIFTVDRAIEELGQTNHAAYARFWVTVPLEVSARRGEHGREVARAEDYLRQEDRKAAFRVYSGLFKEPLDDLSRTFVEARLAGR